MSSRALILHIPKAGGTTFRYLAMQNYRPDEVFLHYDRNSSFNHLEDLPSLAPASAARLRLVMGHFSYTARRHLPEGFLALAMLREPAARLISHYKHAMTVHARYRDLERKPSLIEYLERLERAHADNLQTRMIAGRMHTRRPSDQALLDQALEHLETRFALVGITERFDESALLFGDLLGWRHLGYSRLNSNGLRVPLGQAEQARLEALTQHDRIVYERAKQLFEARVRASGASFQNRLEHYLKPPAWERWLTQLRFRIVGWRSARHQFRHAVQPASGSNKEKPGRDQLRRRV